MLILSQTTLRLSKSKETSSPPRLIYQTWCKRKVHLPSLSCVTCHMSFVRCHISCISCHIHLNIFCVFYKVAKIVGENCHTLRVSWHDIFVFQNMLPISAFIKVTFFLQVWSGNLAQIQSVQKNGPWNWGMGFLVALITFSIDFLVALNTIAWVYLLLLIP